MTDYTRKELAAINAAWRDLAYLADCTSLSPGICTAHMFGAWVATQTGRLESLALNFKTTATAAIAAHDAAQQRAMDAFRKGQP